MILIDGMSILDKTFSTILCYYLTSQAQYSLNLLNKSRVHPQLLAYQVLEGMHDFK